MWFEPMYSTHSHHRTSGADTQGSVGNTMTIIALNKSINMQMRTSVSSCHDDDNDDDANVSMLIIIYP